MAEVERENYSKKDEESGVSLDFAKLLFLCHSLLGYVILPIFHDDF